MSTFNAPILTVDTGLFHKIDTKNVENLFNMWTVFSRCSKSLEQGKRLENLSWRLWNRETFCCDPVSGAASVASIDGQCEIPSLPSLSSSVESFSDEVLESESDHTTSSTSDSLYIARPQSVRQDSVGSRSRGRERHITPDDLEKLVIDIQHKKIIMEPYSPPTTTPATVTIPKPQDESATVPTFIAEAPCNPESVANSSAQNVSSDSGSATSARSITSVVRGFSPSHVSSSYRSIPLLTAPSSIPTADLVAAKTSAGPHFKKRTAFQLGGSSGDDSLSSQAHSIENTLPPKKKAVFSFGASSNEDESSLPQKMQNPQSALTNSLQRPQTQKKQTSFQEEVATRTLDDQQYSDDVFETDDEDVDESAIDEDDSSDWEDSAEESGNASIDDKSFFKRIDSRAQLTTRRSLITTMLHQNDRASALAAAATRSTPALQRSRTTSPVGPSLAASPESDDSALMMMKTNLKPIAEVPRSGPAPQPIIQTTTNGYHPQLALSPRTTRRNMLATELTVSLRQHLLWERQQKSQTANAVLKRRHTAHDVANLKQYPDKIHMGNEEDKDETHASWNQYFSAGLGEYHSKGW